MSLQTLHTDTIGGKGVTYIPTSGVYSNVLVWMHGLGDTADGWASLMPQLRLSNTKFILPTAETRPISLNGGRSMPGWTDIYGLEINSVEDAAGFASASERVNSIIRKEIDEHSVDPSRIILAGFSQGGAVALHTALRSPLILGGCVALSTWVPLRGDYPAQLSAASKSLKILQVHGDEDRVVSYRWGTMAHDLLLQLVTEEKPRLLTIPGMGHSSDPEEMQAVREFIAGIFQLE